MGNPGKVDSPFTLIDRHVPRQVNLVGLDESGRTTYLSELWSLQWHQDFIIDASVSRPW
jgi:hypothetical protein